MLSGGFCSSITLPLKFACVLSSITGLPTVVARNTMLDSKSESVVLPLVARIVQTVDATVNASKFEGVDLLTYDSGDVKARQVYLEVESVYENVKIPILYCVPHRVKTCLLLKH